MSALERGVAAGHQVFAILSYIISTSSVVLQLFNLLCVLVTYVVVIWRTISYTSLIHSSPLSPAKVLHQRGLIGVARIQ